MSELVQGECLEVMRALDANSVDAIVTDPPYALTANKKGGSGLASVNTKSPGGRARIGTGNGAGGFMGKAWDAALPGPEVWAAALRVAKPGAHLVAFGGTRTFYRLFCAIEDAGWQIRDTLSWLYGSGFPKSHNLKGEHDGKGTALKPGWEPIVLARAPLVGTVAENMARYGVGALAIDECRIAGPKGNGVRGSSNATCAEEKKFNRSPDGAEYRSAEHPTDRWPANVVLDEDAAALLDAQSGKLTSGANPTRRGSNKLANTYGTFDGQRECTPARGVDVGGASRFYYCAKASRAERDEGLEHLPVQHVTSRPQSDDEDDRTIQERLHGRLGRNHHPTVKPVALMRWLCRLVTPPGGLVLDPFTGSGSTGIAAVCEGLRFLGIEREAASVEIARARIAHARRQPSLWEAP